MYNNRVNLSMVSITNNLILGGERCLVPNKELRITALCLLCDLCASLLNFIKKSYYLKTLFPAIKNYLKTL